MKKRKVIIIIIAVVLVASIAAAVILSQMQSADIDKDMTYTETMKDIFEKAKSDSYHKQASLYINEKMNNGVNITYSLSTSGNETISNSDLRVNKNGIIKRYANICVRDSENLYLNTEALLSLLSDESISVMLSDSDYTANTYIKSPGFSEQSMTAIDAWVGKAISNRETAASEKTRTDRYYTYSYTGEEYNKLLQSEASEKNTMYEILSKSAHNRLSEYTKESLALLSERFGSETLNELFEKIKSLFKVFETATENNDEITVTETCSSSTSKCEYRVSIKSEEETLAEFEITFDFVKAEIENPLKDSKVIEYEKIMEKLADEIKDTLNDAYEFDDIWDGFTIDGNTLTFVKYEDGVDIAEEFEFLGNKLSSYTVTYRTKELSIHYALRNHYSADSNFVIVRDSTPSEENTGLLVCRTESSNYFPEGYSSCSSPEQLYDLLSSIYPFMKGVFVK